MTELYAAEDFELCTGLDFFATPLSMLFGDTLDRIRVGDCSAIEDNGSTTYSLVLAIKDDLFIQIPGLNGIGLGIIVDSEDESPLIYCELTLGGAEQMLSVQHFPLRIAIANPLLQPVAIEGQAETVDGFSFEIAGGFTISDAPALSATMDSFSVPPFTIVGSGLTLALEECRFVVSADDVDGAITALGFDNAFRGIHAAAALIDWDIPWQQLGTDLPGLHVQLEDIALGNQGIAVAAELTWPVAYTLGAFDAAGTELLGHLFDPAWACALERLNVVVRANRPQALGARGYLRVPFVDAIFALELFASYTGNDDHELRAALALGSGENVSFDLGHPDYQLSVSNLGISGRIEDDAIFSLQGETGISLSLPGLTLNIDRCHMAFDRTATGETFAFLLEQVTLDTFGTLDEARLEIATQRDDSGESSLARLLLEAELTWSDLQARIALAPLPDGFPLPPDDAEVTLRVRWQDDTLQLAVESALSDVDALWRFVPAAQRPDVASASIRIALTVNGADFDGEASLDVRFRLPELTQLPGLSTAGFDRLVQIDSGDSDGWIDAVFTAQLDSSEQPTGSLGATLTAPLGVALNLPGLDLPQPPLVVQIDSIALALDSSGTQTDGELQLSGSFALYPILPTDLGGFVPPMMALQLERLLTIAHLYDLVGSAELRLGIENDDAYLALSCSFSDADLEIDLFDMLAGAAAQLVGGPAGNEIDLDIEVSFALRSLTLTLGQVPESDLADTSGIPFSFGIEAEMGFAGQYTDLVFELSSESLRFGFADLAIPLVVPQLPIDRAALDRLRDADGRWDPAIWLQQIEPQIDQHLNDAQAALDAARDLLAEGDIDDEQLAFELQYRTLPSLQKDVLHYTGRKFLYEAALAIHQLLGQLSGAAAQDTYQQLVETYQDAVDLTLGWVKLDTGLTFEIARAEFVLPFNDPSAIAVEGSASLQGFAADSPLRALADLQFTLGISADAIYFAVEGGADPIGLPDLGRYPGSGIVLDRLAIGYGYSKNSLNIDFAGELQLSPQLVADLDTSRRIGAGIRLPTNNTLKFKLDLIPITLGEVDFVLPLVAFDIDLRSDHPPAASASLPCAPTWDGLELDVPGIVHADLKRAKFSPFFGPLPAPNSLYSYDVDIGNAQLGLTFVCTDYQVITPVLGTIPIPFLADTSPFFDRQCCNLRLAGFGINFELRRPFPHPSPLLIFELFGFLSDPTLPIDPAGHLADLMWAELNNGRILLPPPVHAMFPEYGPAISRELDARINVGSVIALGQHLGELVEQLQTRMMQAGGDMADAVSALLANPLPVDVAAMLDTLPRELRRVELNGAFVGFDASVVFLLITPAALLQQAQPPAPPADDEVHWQNVVLDRFTRNPLRGWRQVDHGLKRGQGDWVIERGALVQRNNVGDNSAGRYGAMLIRETDALSDIRVTVEMHSSDNDGMGVVFHVQNDTTFYRFRITAEQGEWQLMRLKRGRTAILQSTRNAFVPGQDYRIRIETRSVMQATASLRQPVAPRVPPALSPADIRLDRKSLSSATTHIRIWVNEALWCDLADNDRPLTEGLVGLDSWWNKGARFDNFRIDRALRGSAELSRTASLALSRDLLPLSRRDAAVVMPSGPSAAWTADDLDVFDRADLEHALGGNAEAAVVAAARVRVLDNQVYRFIGVVYGDGRFHLSSAAAIAPLQLRVAGITMPAELQVQGRLQLDGHAAGAEAWSRISAALYGEWRLLPSANGAVVALSVGSESVPAQLQLDSRGRFVLRGDARLSLFDDQLVFDVDIDVSDQHVACSGHLDFTPDLFVSGQQHLLALTLDVAGDIGPGENFLLAGSGSLSLFGRRFSDVEARLGRDGIALRARLAADTTTWSINGFALDDAELAVRGDLRFGASTPALLLEGSGRFTVNGALVDGRARLSAAGKDWCIGVGGRLHWQGRDWLQGQIELCRDQLTVGGRTDFALRLTPTQLPVNIEIAGLYLTASVSGSFTLRSSGTLKACAFDIDWTLSIQLPGGHALQALPIAAQQLRIERDNIGGAASVTLADLIAINGWSLLPLQGLTLPIPTFGDDSVDLYLHDAIHVDPPSYTLPITLITTVPPAPGATPDITIPGIVNLYNHAPVVTLPDFDIPLPVLSDTPPEDNLAADPIISIPTITANQTEVSGELRLDNLQLGLKLVWQNGELGIKVAQTDAFHAFASLPPLNLVIIGGLTIPV